MAPRRPTRARRPPWRRSRAVEDAQPQTPPPPPKKKGGFLKIAIFAVLVLVLAGGGGAWWLFGGHKTVTASEPPLESRGLVTFEPFLVNLADAGTHFLKVNV